ncbi:MAG: rRNA adenine N-6-methyltransferase family protein [Candidatus Neomarinimicrobiota bacterium]
MGNSLYLTTPSARFTRANARSVTSATRPKVFSAIIRLNKKPRPLISDKYYIRFEKIVKAAFSQRRKMLRNSLNGFSFYDTIQNEIDFTRRPETLSVEEFIHLAESSE